MNTSIAKIRGYLFTLRIRLLHRNVIIGKGLLLHCKLEIKGKGKVSIGNNCIVRGIPGSRTQYVSIETNSPEAELQIGNSVQLLAAKFSCKFSMTIGNNVVIEDSSILDTDFHSLDVSRATPSNETKKNCSVTIDNNVCIGVRSVVTKGVTIGEGCMVQPCSVVQQSFPAQSRLAGNPAVSI